MRQYFQKITERTFGFDVPNFDFLPSGKKKKKKTGAHFRESMCVEIFSESFLVLQVYSGAWGFQNNYISVSIARNF